MDDVPDSDFIEVRAIRYDVKEADDEGASGEQACPGADEADDG